MLVQSRQLDGNEIASMRTGQGIARTQRPIIDPYRLEVCGFYTNHEPEILLASNIREINQEQLIIDDEEVFSTREELHRLQKVLEVDYQLIGKRVRTQSSQRLGSVEDYIIDTISNKIQKIYVNQPLWRNFHGSTLIVDRSQVIEVDDKHVVVSDAIMKAEQALSPQPPA